MRLKELRESMGISQSELARRLGLPQKTYNNYETGISKIPIELLVRFADYFQVTVDYLIGYSSINYKTDPLYINRTI